MKLTLSKRLILLFIFSSLLPGCFFVAAAAAGAAGMAVVYDHRTLANALQDQKIANAVFEKIRAIPELREESHIEVSAFNQVVVLVGETPNPAWRTRAEELAHNVRGVQRVYNEISIQGPVSSLTKTSDSWITTKIKTKMLATSDLKSGDIKVLTENGVVYLMGRVNREQADIAVSIARRVTGVQKVIKIFQYTH